MQHQGIFCIDHFTSQNPCWKLETLLRNEILFFFFRGREKFGDEMESMYEIVIEGEELCGWAWPEWRDAVNGNPWQPVPRPSIDPSFIEAAQPRPASARPLENSTLSRELKCGLLDPRKQILGIPSNRSFERQLPLISLPTTLRRLFYSSFHIYF